MPKYLVLSDLHRNGKPFKPGDWIDLSEAEALHLSSCLDGVDKLRAERVERVAKRFGEESFAGAGG